MSKVGPRAGRVNPHSADVDYSFVFEVLSPLEQQLSGSEKCFKICETKIQ